MTKEDEEVESKVVHVKGGVAITVILLIVVWVVAGIAAFITSLVCFGKSGTTGQHVIGLLLSLFLGPFYWIYFFAVKGYCGSNLRALAPQVGGARMRPTR